MGDEWGRIRLMTTPDPATHRAKDHEDAGAAPVGGEAPAVLERCAFAGCGNSRAPYQGRGPRPRYCEQEVDGVLHNRRNYFRSTGGGPARRAGVVGTGQAPERSARPVSLARASVPVLVEQMGELLAGQAAAQNALFDRLEAVAVDLAGGDAVAVEVTAVQREARAEIEEAEDAARAADERATVAAADVEEARAAARAALTAAEDADGRAARAEAAAQQSQAAAAGAEERSAAAERRIAELTTELTTRTDERDTARAERDAAVADGRQLAARLEDAHAAAGRQADELAAARADIERLTGTRQALTEQLTGARADTDRERRRAEVAELAVARADAAAAAAGDALHTAREDHNAAIERLIVAAREQRDQDHAAHRDEIERLGAELTAARDATEDARSHLAAAREAAAEQRGALTAELTAARRALDELRERPAEPDRP